MCPCNNGSIAELVKWAGGQQTLGPPLSAKPTGGDGCPPSPQDGSISTRWWGYSVDATPGDDGGAHEIICLPIFFSYQNERETYVDKTDESWFSGSDEQRGDYGGRRWSIKNQKLNPNHILKIKLNKILRLRFSIFWSYPYGCEILDWDSVLCLPFFNILHWSLISPTFMLSHFSTFSYWIEDACSFTSVSHLSCHVIALSLHLKLNVSMWLISGN